MQLVYSKFSWILQLNGSNRFCKGVLNSGCGSGAVLYRMRGVNSEKREIWVYSSSQIDLKNTKTEADYFALIAGLRHIQSFNFKERMLPCLIQCSSHILCKHINNETAIKNKKVQAQYIIATEILKDIPNYSFEYISKKENERAYQLSHTLTLDSNPPIRTTGSDPLQASHKSNSSTPSVTPNKDHTVVKGSRRSSVRSTVQSDGTNLSLPKSTPSTASSAPVANTSPSQPIAPIDQYATSIAVPPQDPRDLIKVHWRLQFDGGSRGNPGTAGAGAVLYRVEEHGTNTLLWKGSKWLGTYQTNNYAEYQALLLGLNGIISLLPRMRETCQSNSSPSGNEMKSGVYTWEDTSQLLLEIQGDSRLIINQVSGKWKVHNHHLQQLHSEVQRALETISATQCNFMYIPRARNVFADGLANIAMETKQDMFDFVERNI